MVAVDLAAGLTASARSGLPSSARIAASGDAEVLLGLLRRWTAAPDREAFERIWRKLSARFNHVGFDLRVWLVIALAKPDGGAPARLFRFLAARRLRADLVALATADGAVTGAGWELLAVLDPPPFGIRIRTADRWTVLGDLVRKGGDLDRATSCYRRGVEAGSLTSSRRLARSAEADAAPPDGDSPSPAKCVDGIEDGVDGIDGVDDAVDAEQELYRELDSFLGQPASTAGTLLRWFASAGRAAAATPQGRFWQGVARLCAGEPEAAIEALRSCASVEEPARGSAERVVHRAARLLLAVLTGDDAALADLIRAVVGEDGHDWAERCVVRPALVVTLATRGDPALADQLVRQLAGRPEHLEPARAAIMDVLSGEAYRILGDAAEALRAGRWDDALLLVGSDAVTSPYVVGGPSGLLARRIADAVRNRSAYLALTVDGQLQPWTEQAQRHWEQGAGAGDQHHLAVAHHARAYDLEAAGDPAAFDHWQAALRFWGEVLGDDPFWDALGQRLAAATGADGAGAVAGPVATAREVLAHNLLGPHVTLAARLVTGQSPQPDAARRHVALIIGSGLPSGAVDAARARLVRDVVARALALEEAESPALVLDEAAPWFVADPTNAHLCGALLTACRRWFENEGRRKGGWARISPVLERAEELAAPLLAALSADVAAPDGDARGPAHARLDFELARLQAWAGMSVLQDASTWSAYTARNHLLSLATEHLRKALELDPELTRSGYPYDQVEPLLSHLGWRFPASPGAATARRRARAARASAAGGASATGGASAAGGAASAAGGPSADNPWEWADLRNPYRATAFQVLDLPPEVTDRAEIRLRIRRRRARIERGAERYPLFGRVVSVAEINSAGEEISGVAGRLWAELLTHDPAQEEAIVNDLTARHRALPVPSGRAHGANDITVTADDLHLLALRTLLTATMATGDELWPDGLSDSDEDGPR
ncbi:hypothetical protein CcI49_07205 [Frankia sp. CcI49]|nr:hypothetical protein CcI49_07205 [Frankia sp. CcI49]